MSESIGPKQQPSNVIRSNTREDSRAHLLWILLALPLVFHLLLVSLTQRDANFNRLDILFNTVVLGYAAIGVLLLWWPRYLSRYLLLCYSLLISFVFAESILNFFHPCPNVRTPYGPAAVQEFCVGDSMPGISAGRSVVTINSRGVRGPDVPLDQADLRILCIGGSTTECWYVSDEKTWPWRLQSLLSQVLSKKVIVDNAGLSGHFTRHHIYQIKNYDPVSKYDYILVLCGFNDAYCFLRENYDQRIERIANEALTPDYSQQVYYRRSASIRIGRSIFYKYCQRIGITQDSAGEYINAERQKRQQAIARKRQDSIPDGLDEALQRYERDLLELIQSCRRQGVNLVMITQPTLYKEDLAPELDQLIWMTTASVSDILKVLNRFNQAMLDLCHRESIDCIDLASRLPKDTSIFYDDCHFNDSGCESVAQVVSEHLKQVFTNR